MKELVDTLQVHESSGIPIYVQLKTQLEYWIATGRIAEDVRLPSVRALAIQLGIAVDTVRQAYDALEQQGLAITKRGLGTFTSLPKGRPSAAPEDQTGRLLPKVDAFLAAVLHQGFDAPVVQRLIHHRLTLLERGPVIAFVGVRPSVERYAAELNRVLIGLPPVRAIAIEDLRAQPAEIARLLPDVTHVVTLVFHTREVDALLHSLPVRVLPLVSTLGKGVMRTIAGLPSGTRPLLVCRQASRPIYSELIRAQRPADETLLYARDDAAEILQSSRAATVILHTTVARAAVAEAGVQALPWIELLHTATRESLDQIGQAVRSDWERVLQWQDAIASRQPG